MGQQLWAHMGNDSHGSYKQLMPPELSLHMTHIKYYYTSHLMLYIENTMKQELPSGDFTMK